MFFGRSVRLLNVYLDMNNADLRRTHSPDCFRGPVMATIPYPGSKQNIHNGKCSFQIVNNVLIMITTTR